uniref:phenylalanine--tRNA ligase n=1 Tax=Mucochytrium quahogii TaxID=96639 RepID=A0A7S2WJX4_9STRA|mmetsp:Transcript_17435/g.28143  ORF Transcript_17435/g.28143 Transcript_17435/m.28143 type:complete len:625 (+) Transcript_17435:53-1927(+)|eukprot:CAMPEP_0203745000 /NCGR_PEP_ID=MMETSP0098-20131031/880_1 /ASSEMBLY_ACC=CAM_ASM_000208 /TAXON_ID=96639 /ORGANISM=" , Strain NY0313808BC1" /LENGTH=624 /DNA_ID=CAMNT_0050632673 /DNA_START=71 /DNA_END=1945 /DNA_ORIENTATION=+
MPTVGLEKELLFKGLGREYTEEEFDQLCFDFGIELDEVVEEEGKEVYKIDIPANRYDLLCLEGLVRSLRVFLGLEAAPVFKQITPDAATREKTKMTVKSATGQIRPFVVCAILRNLKMDQVAYQSCLDLQDQLHRNICRRRTLVSIGTHDLDSVEGPFTYEAQNPDDIKFQHLFADKEMTGREMLDWFRTDPAGKHIKEYTGIIYDSPVYPMVYDKNRVAMSLPPIINGIQSKISKDTKNMFIEVTATDMTKAKVVLNTIVSMFSRYCAEPDTVETVDVHYETPVLCGGETEKIDFMRCPDLSPRLASANVQEIASTIGVALEADKMVALCEKMQLGPVSINSDKTEITVTVPVTRSDILHECDIIEDIAIAYGYNNVVKTIPVSHRPGKELPVNLLADLLRYEVSRQGYMEILSLGLCSREDNFEKILREDPGDLAVTLGNPMSSEFQAVRTTLIPGMLRTLTENLNQKFSEGVRLFEISDVVLRDPKTAMEKDIGCRNERRLAAMHAGMVSSFATIHGLVDRIMQVLAVVPSKEYCPDAANSPLVKGLIEDDACIGEYKIVANDAAMFFPGKGASLVWKPLGATEYTSLGSFGVLHPQVLSNFGTPFPCTILEMEIETFIRH